MIGKGWKIKYQNIKQKEIFTNVNVRQKQL